MKYIRQFLILLAVCCAGEGCRYLIPFPVPASIYGLVLMLACLMSGVVKVHQVEETASFFVDIMPILFIPAGVGLLAEYDALRTFLVPILVITFVTTVIVMGTTGTVAQAMIRYHRRKGETPR